jgi:hypothetical protein
MVCGDVLALAVLVMYRRFDTVPTRIPLANTRNR